MFDFVAFLDNGHLCYFFIIIFALLLCWFIIWFDLEDWFSYPPPPLAPIGVANKYDLPLNWEDNTTYIDIRRPSVFGNPYRMPQYTRNEALDKYLEYLSHSTSIYENAHLLADKILVCSCFPQRCHGNIIIENWYLFC